MHPPVVKCSFFIVMVVLIRAFGDLADENKLCKSISFAIKQFPQNLYRLERYVVHIVVSPYNELFKCIAKKNVFLKWTLHKFDASRDDARGFIHNVTKPFIDVQLSAPNTIAIEDVFSKQGWLLEFELMLYKDSFKNPRVQKHFHWSAGSIFFHQGPKRIHEISKNLTLTVYYDNKTIASNEFRNLYKNSHLRCNPPIYAVAIEPLRWTVAADLLKPQAYQCSARVTWKHIGSQTAQQMIQVVKKSGKFFVRCERNCWQSDPDEETILVCEHCEQQPLWRYQVGQVDQHHTRGFNLSVKPKDIPGGNTVIFTALAPNHSSYFILKYITPCLSCKNMSNMTEAVADKITLICVSNCAKKIAPGDEGVVLKAVCSESCLQNLKWVVEPMFPYILDNSNRLFSLQSRHIPASRVSIHVESRDQLSNEVVIVFHVPRLTAMCVRFICTVTCIEFCAPAAEAPYEWTLPDKFRFTNLNKERSQIKVHLQNLVVDQSTEVSVMIRDRRDTVFTFNTTWSYGKREATHIYTAQMPPLPGLEVKCEPDFFDFVKFPEKPLRMSNHYIIVEVQPFDRLKDCVADGLLHMDWTIEKIPQQATNNTSWSGKVLFQNQTAFFIFNAYNVPFDIAYDPDGWLLTVVLLVEGKPTLHKHFQWWPGDIKLVGGNQGRRHFATQDLKLNIPNDRFVFTTFTLSEKDRLARSVSWSCVPTLPMKKKSSTLWIVPKNMLSPQIYQCTANVSWSLTSGKTILNQFAKQLIEIYDAPNFYIACVKNCWNADTIEKTLLQLKCDSCKDIEWKCKINGRPNTKLEFIAKDKSIIEIPPGSFPSGFKVTFTAVSSNLYGTARFIIYYQKRTPKLSVICLRNCGSTPMTNETTELAVKCENPVEDATSCDGEFTWGDAQYPPYWKKISQVSNNGRHLTIPAHTFRNNEKPDISVFLRSLEVPWLPKPCFKEFSTVISILCKKNCLTKMVDPSKETILHALCPELCTSTFLWVIKSPLSFPALNTSGNGTNLLTIGPILELTKELSKLSVTVYNGKKKSKPFFLNYKEVPALDVNCYQVPIVSVSGNDTFDPFIDLKCNARCVSKCSDQVQSFIWLVPQKQWAYSKTFKQGIFIYANSFKPEETVNLSLQLTHDDRIIHRFTIKWMKSNNTGGCLPTSMKFKNFPARPRRMKTHFFRVQVEPIKTLQNCYKHLQLVWRLKDNHNSAPAFRGLIPLLNGSASIKINSMRIGAQRAYNKSGWILEVILLMFFSPSQNFNQSNPRIERRFRFWPGHLRLFGGYEREHYITNNLTLSVLAGASNWTTFTKAEYPLISNEYHWSCVPSLDTFTLGLQNATVTVPSDELNFGDLECTINIIWLQRKHFILSQSDRQLIHVVQHPPNLFYVRCVKNCRQSNIVRETVVEVQCSTCKEQEILWSYQVLDKWGNLVDEKTLDDHSKRLSIVNARFRRGAQVLYQAQWGNHWSIAEVDYVVKDPDIQIKCDTNCGKTADPSEETIILFNCTSESNPSICESLNIEWGQTSAQGVPAKWPDKSKTTQVSIPKGIEYTVRIQPDTFVSGEQLIFQVKIGDIVAQLKNPPTFESRRYNITIKCVDPQNPPNTIACPSPCDPYKPPQLIAICTPRTICKKEYKWDYNYNYALPNVTQKNSDLFSLNIVKMPYSTQDKSLTITFRVSNGPTISKPFNLTCAEKLPQTQLKCAKELPSSAATKNFNHWQNNSMGTSTFNIRKEVFCIASCISQCENVKSFKWLLPNDTVNWYEELPLRNDSTDRLPEASIRIKPNSFKAGEVTNVVVRAQGPGGEWPFVQFKINWTQTSEISLSIVPVRNHHFNPFFETELTVNCDECADYSIEKFEWSIPRLNDTLVSVDETKFYVLRNDTKSIIIPKKAFKHGQKVQVVAKSGDTKGALTIEFDLHPSIQLMLTCRPDNSCRPCDPRQSFYLHVVCLGTCVDLDYKWTYKPTGNKEAIDITPLAVNEQKDEILVTDNMFKSSGENLVSVTDLNSNSIGTMSITCRMKMPKLKAECIPFPCPENMTHWHPLHPLIVYVMCDEYCEHLDAYEWQITNLSPEVRKNRTEILNNGSKFVVLTNTFKDGDTTTISVADVNHPPSEIKKKFRFILPTPSIQIVCDYNCEKGRKADPRLPIRLHVVCLSECFNLNYRWSYREEPIQTPNVNPDNLVISKNNEYLHIQANTFEINEIMGSKPFLYIYVTTKRTKESYQIFLDEPQSKLKIVCDLNCNPPDPRKPVVLHAECLDVCDVLPYKWEIESRTLIIGDERRTNFLVSDNRSVIKIAPDTFEIGEIVVIRVSTGFKSNAELEITFNLPDPVFNLTCVEKNCDTFAYPELETRFQIDCKENCHPECEILWNVKIKGSNRQLLIDQDWYLINFDQQFVLRPNIMKPNKTLTVSVRFCGIEKSKDVAYIPNLPYLAIQCVINCDFNPKMEIVLLAHCMLYCPSNITYDWHLHPHSLKEGEINFASDQLHIPPNSYQLGTELTVGLQGGGAHLVLKFNFSEPLWEGKCDVSPNTGIAGVTEFTVYCWDFVHFAEMYVFQGLSSQQETSRSSTGKRAGATELDWLNTDIFLASLGVLLAYGPTPKLRNITMGREYNLINVGIGFDFKIRALRQFIIDIKPMNYLNISSLPLLQRQPFYDMESWEDFPTSSVQGPNIMKIINEQIFGSRGLKFFYATNNSFRFVQLVNAIDNEIFGEANDQDLLHYRKHLLVFMSKMNRKIEPIQMVTLLNKMTYLGRELFIDGAIAELTVTSLVTSSNELNKRLEKNVTRYNPVVVRGFAETATEMYITLFSAVYQKLNYLMRRKYNSPDYPLAVELISDEEREIHHAYSLSSQITMGIEEAGSLMYTALVNGEDTLIETTRIYFQLLWTGETFTINTKVPITEDKFIFIKFHPLIGANLINLAGGFLYIVATFNFNLYWLDKVASDLELPILMVSLGNVYDVIKSENNLVQIMFPLSTEATSFTIAITSYAAYQFTADIGAVVLLSVTNPSPNSSITIFLCGEVSHSGEETTSTHLMPNQSQNITFRAPSREVFLIFSSNEELAISGSLKVMGCASWSSRDPRWSKNDCTSHYHGSQQLVCKCWHLSLFGIWEKGAKLSRADVANVYLKNEILFYNYVIILSCVTILLVFAGMFLVALLYDRKLAERERLIFLMDNLPGDSHMYLIVVSTGIWWDSGTSANVGIQLVGEYGSSRRHLLKGSLSGTRCLQRNGNDCFVLYCPTYLGVIKRIRLWHNGCGHTPHWFCERIVVQHVMSKKFYVFNVERWLSLIYGNGRLHHSVIISVKNCYVSYKMSWKQRIRQAWLNQNLEIFWLLHRPGTLFKCVERVAVLMATVFLCMLLDLFLVKRVEYLQISDSFYTAMVTSIFTILLSSLFSKSRPRQLNESID